MLWISGLIRVMLSRADGKKKRAALNPTALESNPWGCSFLPEGGAPVICVDITQVFGQGGSGVGNRVHCLDRFAQSLGHQMSILLCCGDPGMAESFLGQLQVVRHRVDLGTEIMTEVMPSEGFIETGPIPDSGPNLMVKDIRLTSA
jgi:hypothetical protein